MDYPAYVAARYLRRRAAAYVAVGAVTIAVMVLGVVISVMDGFQNQIRANIRGTLSDLSVRNVRESYGIEDEIRALALAEVTGTSPRLTGPVLIDRGGNRNYALEFAVVVGIDAEKEAHTTGFRGYLMDLTDELATFPEGSMPEDIVTAVQRVADFKAGKVKSPFPTHGPGGEVKDPGIIIGKLLARELAINIGDTVNLATVPKGQLQGDDRGERLAPKSIKFLVVGLYETNEYEFAGKHIFMDMREAEDYLEAYTPSEVLVKLTDYEHAQDVKDALREQLPPGYFVATWEDRRRNLLDAIDVERSLMIILLFFVFVVAGFMIWAVLYGMVQEKVKDIGILRAMGATRRGVLAVFMWCGLFIGLLGAAMGTILGVTIAKNLNNFDQALKDSIGWQIFPDAVYGFEEIPVYIDPEWLAKIAFMAFACALVSALIPAWIAARLAPVEALRHD